jgi:hypothetical protein
MVGKRVPVAGRKTSAVATGKGVHGAGAGRDHVSSACNAVAHSVLAAHLVVHVDHSAHRVPARDTVSSGAAM